MRLSKQFSLRLAFIILLASQIGLAQQKPADIREYSLEDLLNVEISTAAKYEQRSEEAPATVTIITSEDIHRYGYRTIEEALNSVRGFYLNYDRNYYYVGVRGFCRPIDYSNRLLLLMNGHTLNEHLFGSAFFGSDMALNLNSIERIEIVRGPGSSLYGTSAMFAVVNVIPKSGLQTDGLKLALETGSYGHWATFLDWGKEFASGLDLMISGIGADIKGQDLYYPEFDSPATHNGIAENLDWEQYYGWNTAVTYKWLSLTASMSHREKGVPTGYWDIEFNNPDAQTLDRRSFLELKYQNKLSDRASLMVRGSFDHYDYVSTYPYAGQPNWHEKADNKWLGAEAQMLWDFRPDNRMILGIESQNHFRAWYQYASRAKAYFDKNMPNQFFSVYLQDSYQLTRIFSITTGLRWDRYSTFGSAITPRIALVHNPLRFTAIKMIYGEAFRVPNVYETNYSEPGLWQVNPNLKPEKIKTIEVAWEQRLNSGLWATISYYHNQLHDLIDAQVQPDSLFQYENLSRVKAHGFELGLEGRLKSGFHGYLNYSYQLARDLALDARLSNSPMHLVKMGIAHKVGQILNVAVEVRSESDRITVYNTRTRPFWLTNLNIVNQTLFGHCQFSVKVRNLFDVHYSLPGGIEHVQPAIGQNGRNYLLKFEYRQ